MVSRTFKIVLNKNYGQFKLSKFAKIILDIMGHKNYLTLPRHDINFIKVCSELAEKCNVEYLSELSYIYLNSFYYLIVEFNDGTETEVVPSNVIRIQFII